MRVNRLLAFDKLVLTVSAMAPMLTELYKHTETGFLGAHTSVYWKGVMVVQYWRTFDHLVAYAQARDANHLPAWKAFNERVGIDGSVGIWHETYQVAAGQHETIYNNMPRWGLAQCGEHVPAVGTMHNARSRMAPLHDAEK